MPPTEQRSLKAQYTSPTGSHEFDTPIVVPCKDNPSTDERTKYLAELRANTKTLQADVNKFLTEKMEEDKARSDGAGAKDKKNEDLEEQNYGEEQAADGD